MVLSRDPLADVWIAIRESNVNRFALNEKIDAVLTYESHVFEVERNAARRPFRGDERFQLGNVLLIDPATPG